MSTFKLNRNYDIILSETMQACLEKEPQIHIMRNLAPQMHPDAIFIPEEISLKFYLNDYPRFMEKILYENKDKNIVDKRYLDDFFTLNKQNAMTNSYEKIIEIPPDFDSYKDLMIFTFITVYKNEKLKERESSLNNPKEYYDFSKAWYPAVKFKLDFTGRPKIKTEAITKEEA